MNLLQFTFAWLTLASVVSFAQFGWDKRCAGQDKPRLPERVLLAWSVAGGAAGAILGMVAFRHKIRKPSFWVVQVMALALWGWGVAHLG